MPVAADLLGSLRTTARRARGKVRGRIKQSYARLAHALNWSYLNNPRSARLLQAHRPTLTEAQRRSLDALKVDGLAFVQSEALGVDPGAYRELRDMVQTFARSDGVRDRIREFPALAAQRPLVGDDYMVKFYPEGPTLSLANPFLRVGLSPAVLDVVNSYLGMWCKLIYMDAWHTIPVDIGRRIGSQSWHRDPEDRRMIKAYLYFGAVDANAGPMEYIPGSPPGGRYQHLWPWMPKSARAHRYPDEAEVARLVPASDRVACVGEEGTLVLSDTSGLHRGGISNSKARLLATWTYVTPAALVSTAPRRFTISDRSSHPALSPAAAFAIA